MGSYEPRYTVVVRYSGEGGKLWCASGTLWCAGGTILPSLTVVPYFCVTSGVRKKTY